MSIEKYDTLMLHKLKIIQLINNDQPDQLRDLLENIRQEFDISLLAMTVFHGWGSFSDPIYLAAKKQGKCFEVLLQSEVEYPQSTMYKLMVKALNRGHSDHVAMLFKHGFDPSYHNLETGPILHLIIKLRAVLWDPIKLKQCDPAMEVLLSDSRTDVNQLNSEEKTPMMLAIEMHGTYCVRLLLRHGADIHLDQYNYCCNQQTNPMANFRYREIVRLFERGMVRRAFCDSKQDFLRRGVVNDVFKLVDGYLAFWD